MRNSKRTTQSRRSSTRRCKPNAGEARVSATVATTERARISLCERLTARRAEIEQAALTRVYAVADPNTVADPDYAAGLRATVSAALDYGLDGIGASERHPPQVPAVLLAQARLAAANGVNLDTVLRRYFAGYALFGDFLIEEAERGGLFQPAEFKHLLRAQASLFERLLAIVGEEYGRGAERRVTSSRERRAKQVRRLLDGELLDTTSDLAYDFEGSHLGAIVKGPAAAEAIRELADRLGRRLLAVCPADEAVWAWLGGRHSLDLEEVRLLASTLPTSISLAIGEPGEGMAGWRHTHRQARAASQVVLRGSERFVRYADVALVTSMLQDELLTMSLREIFLDPLEEGRGGDDLRETLHAYFAAERNVSSAAATLEISRQAVARRLRTVEARLGRSLGTCELELQAALRLETFSSERVAGHICNKS